MSFAPGPKDKALSIDVFGSLVTEIAPNNLPNGVSPDNSDCQFLPGSVFSRAALKRLFPFQIDPGRTINYAKSYIDPSGIIRNFFLTSDGGFWVQTLPSPTVAATPLFQITAGSVARSTTAFGREYIAISDGFHGTVAPLQITGLPDGTLQIDRVTHDAPGAPPSISNLIIPPVDIVPSGSPISLTIVEVDPENADPGSGFFTSLNVYTSSALTGVVIGQTVIISGTTGFDGVWGPITAIYPGTPNSLIQVSAYIPSGTPFWTGSATMTISQGALQRQSNVVTGMTATVHQLRPGYRVNISNALASQIGTGITSIVINNESAPGIATVTVALAGGATNTGLAPGLSVSITGVKPVTVGGTISSIIRAGGIVTATMSATTGLTPGAIVTVNAAGGSAFNGIVSVVNVSTTTNPGDTFTYLQTDADATGATGGTVGINWPIPNTPTPTFFEVVGIPSDASFQIALNYADSPSGGWTTGKVTFAWDGTFFVQTTPTPTSFTYQQYGPDSTASAVSGSIIATPTGQASPGQHQVAVAFQDRQGGITALSPPFQFVANGGQYLSLSNIPIGPPGTVARIICFTGAQGAFFFYVPTIPQVNGQIVGTSTVVSDNTTTAAIFDFSDVTLFSALGVSIQGNNLPNQVVLDGALGFGFYASRLVTWGQRNYIQPGGGGGGMLNMGFDGGYNSNVTTKPLGWDSSANVGGGLINGNFGQIWDIAVSPGGPKGQLSQSMYQTAIGSPIATGGARYRLRGWFLVNHTTPDVQFIGHISSASTGFLSVAVISGVSIPQSGVGIFVEADFSAPMPDLIPADLILTVYAQSFSTTVDLQVDDLFLILAESPYFLSAYASYGLNPAGFDGVSGILGPIGDSHPVTNMAVLRQSLNLLTRDPGGHLYITADNGVTEPSGWTVDGVATECGALSAFCVTQSQHDDLTASGGEEWFAWASASGMRIHSGGPVWKISQEIQPNWTGLSSANDSTRNIQGINPAAAQTIWVLNDPGQMGKSDTGRVIYVGLPIGQALQPNKIFQMDYKELDTAEQIAAADPVRVGFGGKLIATDHSRKWSPWNLGMNGAALIYTSQNAVQLAFMSGLGAGGVGFANVYTLDSTKLTDDDYGQIFPYYATYFMPERLEEQSLQLGSGRHQHVYTSAFISGTGIISLVPLVDTLANLWPLSISRSLTVAPKFDLEGPGTALGQRIAILVKVRPSMGTDNGFVLSKLALWMRPASHLPVRGAAA